MQRRKGGGTQEHLGLYSHLPLIEWWAIVCTLLQNRTTTLHVYRYNVGRHTGATRSNKRTSKETSEHVAPLLASLLASESEHVRATGQQLCKRLGSLGDHSPRASAAAAAAAGPSAWQARCVDADAVASAVSPTAALRTASHRRGEVRRATSRRKARDVDVVPEEEGDGSDAL